MSKVLESLEKHLRKKAAVEGFNLGDRVRYKGLRQTTIEYTITQIELFEDDEGDPVFQFTITLDPETVPNHTDPDEFYEVYSEQISLLRKGGQNTPAPKFQQNSYVKIMGNHDMAGGVSKVYYAFVSNDVKWANEWCYMMDEKLYKEFDTINSIIPERDLIQITKDQYEMYDNVDSPVAESEEDLVIE